MNFEEYGCGLIDHINASEEQAQYRRSQHQQGQVLDYEQGMSNWRSRHLILVLTLRYNETWRHRVTLEELRNDRDHFFRNLRCNRLLQGIKGYIWKIEFGWDHGGFHMHVVLFYDGECRSDVYYAQQIGEYWKWTIAPGRGDYWNSNAHKGKFENGEWGRFGNITGQVDRGDFDKRSRLQAYLVEYIAKDDQHVLRRANPHIKLFSTGYIPT